MQPSPDTQSPPPASTATSWAQAYLEASLAIAHSPQPVDLLRALLRFAGPGFTQARFGLIDAAAPTRARILAEAELGAVRSADYPDRISDYPGWDTLADRDAIIIPDMLADPALFPDQRDRLRARRITGLVIVPMVSEGNLLGVLILSSHSPLTIEPARIRALRILLDQVARESAVHRARETLDAGQHRLNRYARQLDAVTRLALRAGTFADSQSLYEYAVREMVQLLKADHGGVLLLDADEAVGTVVAEFPSSGALGSRLVMAGNELFEMVRVQRGVPVIANHVAENQHLLPDTRTMFDQLGLKSIMFIPILQGGRIIASIGMDLFTAEREFDEDVAETAQAMAAQVSGTLENIHRAEELSRQLSTVEALSALASSIYRLREDERSLFDSIGVEVTQTTRSDHAAFYLFDADDVSGRLISEYPPRGQVDTTVELAASLLAEPLRQRQAGIDGPVVINDAQSNPRISEAVRAGLARDGVHAQMFIPYSVDERLVGMAVFSRTGEVMPYGPDMQTIARTIGVELSAGLQNVRLVQEARRRAVQLERIAEFTRTAQSSETIEGVLESAIGSLRELVPADRIGVLFYDDVHRELRLAGRYQDGASAVQLRGGPLVGIAGTYAGQVWANQTPLTIADTREGVASRARGDTGIRSMALFPFNGGTGLRGVISMGSALPRSYSESDVAVLQQMANQFAAALDSRASLASKQAAAEQEALVNTLGARYQRAADVNDMLATTLRELGDHLGAKRGRIRLSMEPAPVTERAGSGSGMDVW